MTVVALALLTAAVGGFGEESPLAYRREAVLEGAWWRLLSGQLVHLNGRHLMVNLAAYVLIWQLFIRSHRLQWWWVYLLAGGLATGLGLLWLRPDIEWYVGLSGALHGLLIAAALEAFRYEPRWATVLLVALSVKLMWEHLVGATPGMDQWLSAPVVTVAHLFGALGVVPLWLGVEIVRRRKVRR